MIYWKRAAVCILPALVFLGFCLYFMFNYLISWASPPYVLAGFEVTYLQSTMLSNLIPWFFWTALGFVIASVGVDLYIGSHHLITKEVQWEPIIYVFGSALLIDILLNTAFIYLIDSVIPTLPGLGTGSQEWALIGFFADTCLFPLFCFLLAGIGIGALIGSFVDIET